MATPCRTALAVDFDHVSAAPDLVVTLVDEVGAVPVTLPSGRYRMSLAPSTGDVQDLLRALEAAANAAITAASALLSITPASSIALSLGPSGVLTLTQANIPFHEIDSMVIDATLAARLGLATSYPSTEDPIVGAYPVWHLALFAQRVSSDWSPRTPMAGGVDAAGVGYGVTSGLTTYVDEVAFGWVPRDVATVAQLALEQTPWEPDPQWLESLGQVAGRAYSLSDLVREAQGRTCAFARGNVQALLTSTTERYDLVTIPTDELSRPRLARARPGWDAYRAWTTRLIRQASPPTGTRA